MRYSKICFWLIALFFPLLSACTDDLQNQSESNEASIQVNVRSALYTDIPDNKVTGLRIMAFDTQSHLVRSNKYYNEAALSDLLTHTMNAGIYDFVIIANEPRDGVSNVTLDRVIQKADLDGVSFPATSFIETKDIPMIRRADDVTVLPDNEGVEIVGVKHQIWNIVVNRLATRMDFTIYSSSGVITDFSGVTLTNLPDAVPLYGDYSGTRTTTRTYTVAANPTYFTPTTVPGAAWAVKLTRIIIPSNNFSPADQINKAIGMSIQLASEGLGPSGTLGIDEQNGDYTLPNNQYLQINANVKYPVEVNIAASEWTNVPIDAPVWDNRLLSLSSISADLTEYNMYRVYFHSNLQNIFVEPTGLDANGNTFNTNDLFPGVAGVSPVNLHYTSGTNEGYFDLYTEIVPPASPYRIYVNAGGFRREFIVRSTAKLINTWANHPYRGTFHRWNQTGERVVKGRHIGAWSAQVEYIEGQPDFVVLGSGRSVDPKLGTATPGDAEQYQVTDGSASISGTGNIFFRVGLTSKLASASSAPRYARIRVNQSAGTSYIYVRQGEAADYVMRPQDLGGDGSSWGTPNRPLANKFSPYNLTDPNKTINKATAGTRGYVFTDYPTQVGYFFPWGGSTDGWYPVASLVNYTYPDPGQNTWDAAWETCPPGYRRMDDGSATTATAPTIANSEVRQSLWYIPQEGTTENGNNMLWGNYADGSFDRKRFEGAAYVDWGSEMAYCGVVIFNPNAYNSIFIPAGGYRYSSAESSEGAIVSAGSLLYYWTRKSNGASNAQYLTGRHPASAGNGNLSMNAFNRMRTLPIRCVVE